MHEHPQSSFLPQSCWSGFRAWGAGFSRRRRLSDIRHRHGGMRRELQYDQPEDGEDDLAEMRRDPSGRFLHATKDCGKSGDCHRRVARRHYGAPCRRWRQALVHQEENGTADRTRAVSSGGIEAITQKVPRAVVGPNQGTPPRPGGWRGGSPANGSASTAEVPPG